MKKKNEKLEVFARSESLYLMDAFDKKTIDEAILSLEEFKKKLKEGERGELSVDYCGHDGGMEVELHIYRMETDKEFKERLSKEEKDRQKAKLAREKQKEKARKILMENELEEKKEYERLKAKFEK